MRIAVYTIAKNEQQFVERWQQSACDADSLHILDTGSNDGTVTAARDLGIDVQVHKIDPWRFDKARNLSLAMMPENIDRCIALDMDEVLVEGWRDKLESVSLDITRPRYEYTWSWESEGVPGIQYGADKIHSRHGYRWKHPVHEVLVREDGEETQAWCDVKIHHHPDDTKSRSQYLPLLELAVKEDPDDDRNAHYLAREYYFNSKFKKAEKEFHRHLSLPRAKWKAERAQSYRYLYKITKDPVMLAMAAMEDPTRREPHVDLAFHHYELRNWDQSFVAAETALKVKERPLEYLVEPYAWGPLPYDLAAIAAHNLGIKDKAVLYGEEAVKLSPDDDRLVDNLMFYLEAAA